MEMSLSELRDESGIVFPRVDESFWLKNLEYGSARRSRLDGAAGSYVFSDERRWDVRETLGGGRIVRSPVLYVGSSHNLLRRLSEWHDGHGKNKGLQRLLGRRRLSGVRVQVHYTSRPRRAEARAILAHVRKTQRLPAFNRMTEFNRACDELGICLSKDAKTKAKMMWIQAPR